MSASPNPEVVDCRANIMPWAHSSLVREMPVGDFPPVEIVDIAGHFRFLRLINSGIAVHITQRRDLCHAIGIPYDPGRTAPLGRTA
ncbi:hypothetical protein [Arthrobacter sp. 35W]|uniref:hypothetical protein n=1 Tax=Arthrobacter sp. 35W TaxID=1132441 RepID=UPI0012DFE1D6|nr:hypothetical protein [Arthrobacter sp. 35W]